MHLTTQKKLKILFLLAIVCLLGLLAFAYFGFLIWGEIEFPFGMRESFSVSVICGLAIFSFYSFSYGVAEGFAYGLTGSIGIGFDLGCFGALAIHLIHGVPVSLLYCLKMGVVIGLSSGLAYSLVTGPTSYLLHFRRN